MLTQHKFGMVWECADRHAPHGGSTAPFTDGRQGQILGRIGEIPPPKDTVCPFTLTRQMGEIIMRERVHVMSQFPGVSVRGMMAVPDRRLLAEQKSG